VTRNLLQDVGQRFPGEQAAETPAEPAQAAGVADRLVFPHPELSPAEGEGILDQDLDRDREFIAVQSLEGVRKELRVTH
jgi:hypothetical protein